MLAKAIIKYIIIGFIKSDKYRVFCLIKIKLNATIMNETKNTPSVI